MCDGCCAVQLCGNVHCVPSPIEGRAFVCVSPVFEHTQPEFGQPHLNEVVLFRDAENMLTWKQKVVLGRVVRPTESFVLSSLRVELLHSPATLASLNSVVSCVLPLNLGSTR